MLHELSHNQCGPHDSKFYALWDELREEWASLQSKGYSGEGFLTHGKKVGGRRIPVDEVRRQARIAAQQRAKDNAIKHSQGHVLGGAPAGGRDIRAVIADAATKRTTNLKQSAVNSGCANGTRAGQRAAEDALKNGFRTKAEMDDANDVAIAQALADLMEQDEENAIELGSPPPDGLEWSPEKGLQPTKSPTPSSSSGKSKETQFRAQQPNANRSSSYPQSEPRKPPVNPNGRPISRVVLEAEAQRKNKLSKPPPYTSSKAPASAGYISANPQSSLRDQWSCLTCTLTNEPLATQCAVCDTQRSGISEPPPYSQIMETFPSTSMPLGWLCRCGTFMENEWWTCTSCGTMKPSS
jgi:hypothetical protein